MAQPTTPATAPLLEGTVTFIQHHVPPMEAGEYALTVAQEVELQGHGTHEMFVAQARFAVTGERFALNPADIDSVFPPANSEGDFYNVLPHVVITRRTLPWERSPMLSPPAMSADGVPTWLALLVFDQADPAPEVKAVTVADLVGADAPAGGRLPSGTISYPGLGELDLGETYDDPCLAIDVPLELFQKIAPSVGDLKWLAHARQASTRRKSGALGAATAETTDYAVIVANRLPAMGNRSAVHLVSLEGLENCLPDATGAPNPHVPPGTQSIRLVSLKSWTFQTLKETLSFSACLEGLNGGSLRLPDSGSAPATAEDTLVRNALAMGYVALDHDPRDGGHTVSWYRGPLVPYAVQRTGALPIGSPDAATRYDPATGLFDMSYAVAWQTGRLLALQDRLFATALYRWKIATRRDAVAQAERAVLAARLGDAGSASDLRGMTIASLSQKLGPVVGADATPAEKGPSPAPPAADDGGAPPQVIVEWLARLRLLKGVPFNGLVPDEAMLPVESIRFFHLDMNWLDCLADGAYSLGRFTTGDLAHDETHGPDLHDAAARAAGDLHGAHSASAAAPPSTDVTGFLLRSQAASHWPGMEIDGYGVDGSTPLRILRFEQLSPNLLLCLFDGVVGRVMFSMPPEGLHFGLDTPNAQTIDPATFFKRLRALGGGKIGDPLDGVTAAASFRPGLVLRVAALAGAMQGALQAKPFTTAEFALEMVEGVGRVNFVVAVAPPVGR